MLAIAYRSRNVPQALMNLILNNEFVGTSTWNEDDLPARLEPKGKDIRGSSGTRSSLNYFGAFAVRGQ